MAKNAERISPSTSSEKPPFTVRTINFIERNDERISKASLILGGALALTPFWLVGAGFAAGGIVSLAANPGVYGDIRAKFGGEKWRDHTSSNATRDVPPRLNSHPAIS